MQQDARSAWSIPLMLAPYAAPLIRRVADVWPDANLACHIQVSWTENRDVADTGQVRSGV